MDRTLYHRLIKFLREDLGLPTDSISLALKYCEQNLSLLPITLWQFGLVTLEQLDQIFDWLETT